MRTFILLFLIVSGLLASRPPAVDAVTCNPVELMSCASAISSSAPPTATCCAKLREQQPCFCQYMRDSNLKGYVSSGNGRRMATACKVQFPNC